MQSDNQTYEFGERAKAGYKADKFGLWPGVAGIYIEEMADVFCSECAGDILTDEMMARIRKDDLGHDHELAGELGNIAAVLSSEEWDCPGARCGHCQIQLDIRVAHYDEVCREGFCPLEAEA
jgi:hypothetical protein